MNNCYSQIPYSTTNARKKQNRKQTKKLLSKREKYDIIIIIMLNVYHKI